MIPRIHLALDNCFASKRWTEPSEWMGIARDIGITCIEASADNECDPLYNTPDTLQAWIEKVQSASAQTGVKVVNLYSGHGTYATLGLAHTDPRVRDHIQHHWLEPMIRSAAVLDSGLGFFCHAFPQSVLAEPIRYAAAVDDLYTRLSELAVVAASEKITISVEQMYSPHQIPWTISGSQQLLRDVYAHHQSPLYLTLDTGHQVGQRRYLQLDVQAYVEAQNRGEQPPSIWLGPLSPDADKTLTIDTFKNYVEGHPYLFASATDGDLYAWLRMLGCYSPIIHLQQTDGTASAHRPFTEANNRTGIVKPLDVLQAIWEAYQQPPNSAYPLLCDDIYLTLEIFSGTADHPAQILANIRESVSYWRQFIPQDGLPLDQLNVHN